MSSIDDAVKANEAYAEDFSMGSLAAAPARKLAVVACMDARLDILRILGLKPGDAHIIRNAGGIADESALRSLIVAHHLLGVEEFMFIHHVGCGMLTFKEEELTSRLRRQSGASAVVPGRFYAFSDIEEDVREQAQKVRSHPWIPKSVLVRAFIYDVKTGRLKEVPA